MKIGKILSVIFDLIILVAIFVGIYQVEGENKTIMFAIFMTYCKTLAIFQKLERRSWNEKG